MLVKIKAHSNSIVLRRAFTNENFTDPQLIKSFKFYSAKAKEPERNKNSNMLESYKIGSVIKVRIYQLYFYFLFALL